MSAIRDSLGQDYFRRALIEAMLAGAVAGAVGVHVLLRRLPFFVVAMSHATFPGVVLASVLGVSLFLGGSAFGLLVVVAIAALGRSRRLDESSLIGVVLAGSFAVGVLIQSAQEGGSKDLAAFLVGSVLTSGWDDIVTTAAVGSVLLGIVIAFHKELVFGAFDEGGLAAVGLPAARLNLLLHAVVAVAMVTTVPAVGTLLAVALLTVPALTARLWVDRVTPMMVVAGAIGAVSGIVGLLLSAAWDIAAGGAIVLTAAAVFVLSLTIHGQRTLRT